MVEGGSCVSVRAGTGAAVAAEEGWEAGGERETIGDIAGRTSEVTGETADPVAAAAAAPAGVRQCAPAAEMRGEVADPVAVAAAVAPAAAAAGVRQHAAKAMRPSSRMSVPLVEMSCPWAEVHAMPRPHTAAAVAAGVCRHCACHKKQHLCDRLRTQGQSFLGPPVPCLRGHC
eukprot:scaffold19795_cov19-Tisochrysis_lutea.AAC.3